MTQRKNLSISRICMLVVPLVASAVMCVISGILYSVYGKSWLFSMAVTFGTITYHVLIRIFSPVFLFYVFHREYHYGNFWFRQKPWELGVYQFLKVKKFLSYISGICQ